MSERLISIGDTAKILGVSIDTLRRWDESGKFLAIKTPGGHRTYDSFQIALFTSDVAILAQRWAEFGGEIASEFYCGNHAVFQTRLTRMESELGRMGNISGIVGFVTAITGELGDNSFAHNVANWPDDPGIFLAHDTARRRVILADRGNGVWKTLRRVRTALTNDEDALRVAFTEVVSGRAPEARGNGLKFVREAIVANAFHLYFQSGQALAEVDATSGLSISARLNPVRGSFALFDYSQQSS